MHAGVAGNEDPALPGARAAQHEDGPDVQAQAPGRPRAEEAVRQAHLGRDGRAGRQVGRGPQRMARTVEGLHRRTHLRARRPVQPKASRHRWWWTHEELRRCYRRLERLFREGGLFAYLEPELLKGGPVARTTNRLEGGVNSVVKDVLRNHRGLPEEHMRRACEWVCYMKTAHPRPESFIPDALRKGEKATTPEPDDSVAPAYGTGIDWNEFHTTTRYPNTTD